MWQMHSIRYNAHLSNYIFGRYSLWLFLAKPYLPKKECIICWKNKTSSTGSGYEELTKCSNDAAANSIITHVNNTDYLYGKNTANELLYRWCNSSRILVSSFMLTRNYASENKKNEKNKEDNDADDFQQQCFHSLKKYVEKKIILEGQFLRMTTTANYYRQLQE